MAKKKKVSFSNKIFTIIVKLKIVHTYLNGTIRTRGFYGERYFIIFIDDFVGIL